VLLVTETFANVVLHGKANVSVEPPGLSELSRHRTRWRRFRSRQIQIPGGVVKGEIMHRIAFLIVFTLLISAHAIHAPELSSALID